MRKFDFLTSRLIYYLVRLFYPLESLFVDIERYLKVLDSLTFDAENYFDDNQALNSAIKYILFLLMVLIPQVIIHTWIINIQL